MITFMSLMFAELYFAVVLCIDGLKLINELELELEPYKILHKKKKNVNFIFAMYQNYPLALT